jgi:hypothetical protein
MRPIDDIKEDWEMVKKRYTYWWAHEMFDRVLLLVTAPRQGVQRSEWPGGAITPEVTWTNPDYMV